MEHGKYHNSVSPADKKNYEEIIRVSSRFPEFLQKTRYGVDSRAEAYRVKSKMKAVKSRNEISNLTVQEEILLRIYGRFALVLNRRIRMLGGQKTLSLTDSAKQMAKQHTDDYMTMTKFNSGNDVAEKDGKFFAKSLNVRHPDLTVSLTSSIDQIIFRNKPKDVNTDYFYRISRAKKNIYVDDVTAVNLALDIKTTIQVGNIVIDRAINSVGVDLQSILYRYSADGQSATHQQSVDRVNEEEILYVIKNTDSASYMEISGFKLIRPEINNDGKIVRSAKNKLLKGQDEFSSGEIIFPSHTPFRVSGIQKQTAVANRKVVFLEPMHLRDINPSMDIVQNGFDGASFNPKGAFDIAEFAD